MTSVAMRKNETEKGISSLGIGDLTKPFGLVLGKTRMKDLEEDFVITSTQGEGFTGGAVVQVIQRITGDQISDCIILAFNKEKILDAAWFTLPSADYDKALTDLSNSFQLIDTNSPIKGSNSALFYFSGGQIAVQSPLFSQEMTMTYRTHAFDKARMDAAAQSYE
ncbi:hypothetical protein R2571_007056 [Pseudomonas aeruginosa]|nr:hypothetical protein [Pseudomonas aeruginosa]